MTELRTFEDAEAVLAQRLPRYESRPTQQDLARFIETEFFGSAYDAQILVSRSDGSEAQAPRAAFGHAPTGLGKSMAYLIPAILSGKRVVVSVTTKALQDQLANQDLPFLHEHLTPFTWAVLKGRSNYLCLNRAADVPEGEHADVDRVLAWAQQWGPGFSGLREDLPFAVEDRAWSLMCAQTEDCTAMGCSDEPENCYVYAARARAMNSRIVVVNHALYFTDLKVRTLTRGNASLLGDFEWTIFDEAHEVHEVASSSLGTDLTLGTFRSLAGNVRAWGQRYGDQGVEEALGTVAFSLLPAAERFFASLPLPSGRGDDRQKRIRGQHLEPMADGAIALLDALDDVKAALGAAKTHPGADADKAKKRRASLLTRAANAAEALTDVLSADLSEVVRWTEVDIVKGERRVTLKMAPVDISGYLRDNLFTRSAVLMVSATLAVKGKFTFQADQLGVDNFTSKIVGTPFDYRSNTRLYVPLLMDEPKSPAWESQATNQMLGLINAAQGRTLVLFTSVAHMRRAYEALVDVVDYPMKMQGQEPVAALKEWFLGSNDSVLFGTKSFMTGFDARGEACSQVIITKMPFPVPTEPLTEARCERIRAKGGSDFADYSVPVMSLILQQAVGRLMRHTTDMGVVAILDHRIVSKGYGKQILRDLPPMPVVHQPHQVQEFLAITREHFEAAL